MHPLASCVVIALMTGVTPNAASQAAPDPSGHRVVMVAHRGGLDHGYPENTLAAFRHALESGVDVIELDLRGTRDGAIVVMHDDTVNRTTDGSGPVAGKTLAELKRLDAGRGERIPTFEEVLALVAGTKAQLLLDIKESAALDLEKVVRLTEQAGAVDRVIVGPRTLEDLRTFQRLNRDLRTLGFVEEIEHIEPFIKAGVDIVRLWPDWITADPRLVASVQKHGRQVWTTTDDAPREELVRLIRLGVNGIISDWPKVMRVLRADLAAKPR